MSHMPSSLSVRPAGALLLAFLGLGGLAVLGRAMSAPGSPRGVVGVFDIDRRWDARLEVTVHSIRTDYRHTPVFITAGVSYHF